MAEGHLATFGEAVARRFATGGGKPEDLLRGPLENLLGALAGELGFDMQLAGEHHLADERVRPDYAVYVAGVLVGFLEVKAPGKGVDPARYRGHDRQQWQRLSCLPNVMYTDGQSFALFRDGERHGDAVRLDGDVKAVGAPLNADPEALETLLTGLLSWAPISPRRPRELAARCARLCRLLRAEVSELLVSEIGLQDLAADWRRLLFPDASDAQFADGYAQTVTFAMLLARVEGIELAGRDLRDVSDELGANHTLMARALAVLTDPAILPKLAVSVGALQRVLSVVDWTRLSHSDPAAWLYFYEEFLDDYDPALRKKTGSYYTPIEAVDPMVRLVEDLLRERLGQSAGFASDAVTVVDPAVGTGTFLFRVIDRIARAVADDEGIGAVGPRLREAAGRLVGFELQAGPYSVAELRLSTDLKARGTTLGADELRLYLTDTLGNPFVEAEQLAATYRPIAISRQRANAVKREEPVVVVIGNPPYKEKSRGEGGWVEQGSPGGSEPPPLRAFMPPPEWGLGAHVKHLYNPYVYFWRWAAWKVFEHHPSDRGVVAFVTVAGFLNGPGFAGMRRHLRRTADAIWVIDCTPEGYQPEVPTRIFADVQQPLCITIALRDGSTDADQPADVRFTTVSGQREDKFASLAQLALDGAGWQACPAGWADPFLPAGSAAWTSLPALSDLLGWSGSGTMTGRGWVIAPDREVLRARWRELIAAPADRKRVLLDEHERDRTIDKALTDNLPGLPTRRKLIDEDDPEPELTNYGYRLLDRELIVADKRVINQPNPGLWQIRDAPGQVYLTALTRHRPTGGPALDATALVPDLHHYQGGYGGRAWPLWLDGAGTRGNVREAVLEGLAERLGRAVDATDVFAYVAGITAHPGFTERFLSEMTTPGLRVPVTADAELFERVAELGRRTLWLHTFGERFADPSTGRPPGPPRVENARRPRVRQAIPDDPEHHPEEMIHHADEQALAVGAGIIAPVSAASCSYGPGSMPALARWFSKRQREPEGKGGSPLDEIVRRGWPAAWTTELLNVLNVLELLVDLDAPHRALLDEVLAGPLLDAALFEASDDSPALLPERPARQARL